MLRELVSRDTDRYLQLSSYFVNSRDEDHILNRRDLRGETPLYLACRNGNLEVVKFLVEKKCNLELLSPNEDALTVAVRWNHSDIVRYLLEHLGNTKLPSKSVDFAQTTKMNEIFSQKGFKKRTLKCCELI